MDLETKFKKVTGFDAYEDNNLRPKVPSDYYVEWLEEKLIEKAEKLQTKHETEQLRIHSVVVPKVTLCGCGAELIKDAIGIEYCGNTLCKGK